MGIINKFNIYILILISTFFTGCDNFDKGWAGKTLPEQSKEGSIALIKSLEGILFFIGLIVLTVGIHDLFIADRRQSGSSAVGHILWGSFKIIAGFCLITIRKILEYFVGA